MNKKVSVTEILHRLIILRHLEEYDSLFCVYCGKILDIDEVHIDHKTPLSKGGRNESCNLCIACKVCNAQKRDKTVFEYLNWLIGFKQGGKRYARNKQ